MLRVVLHVERIDDAQQGGDMEDIAEDKAEPVDANQRKGIVEDPDLPVVPRGEPDQMSKAGNGKQQHIGRLQAPPQ